MRYSELADIYEELENESGKIAKTEVIAKLLKQAQPEILPKLVMLLIGRVQPIWGAAELGMADRMVIRAIAKASGESEEKVAKKYGSTGDLGLTAEELVKNRKQRSLASRHLTVEDVFSKLQKVAEQTGPGSQERKTGIVVELLSQAGPKEARYIIRTVLEQLRVGVAEGLLRDAIALAFGMEPDIVEAAWFVRPDYGEIAEIARKKGENALRKMEPEIGVPLMVQLAEKAPDLKTALESFKRVVCEYKYDGARLVIHKGGEKVRIFTRRLEDVTAAFPDVLEAVKKAISAAEFIVEGEALAIDAKTGKPQPFQMLSQRIKRKHGIKEAIKDVPVELHLFDILYLNGKTMFDKNLEERFEILKKTVKVLPGRVELARRLITTDLKQAEEFYKKALADGQEGLMIKDLDAHYTPGRKVAGGWLKVKPILETLDLAIVGAVHGTGKRAGWLGSYILGVRDPETGKFLECGMLGTGVKEKKTEGGVTLDELTKLLKPDIIGTEGNQVKVRPKVIIEVAYEEIQKSPTYSSGYALRFPRFIRLRIDKAPEEADDLNRMKAIYGMQKGKKTK
ncbi:MAG: ATP-dependent DNA ligase [Candidatus Aenigmatarchaeota archaeon]